MSGNIKELVILNGKIIIALNVFYIKKYPLSI